MQVTVLGSGVPRAQCCSGLGHWVWARQHRMPWRYAGQCIAMVVLAALLYPSMAWPQQSKPFGQLTDWLRVNGEMRGRIEYSNFFQPAPATNNNNEYTFGAIRARLGLSAITKLVDAVAQAEYSGLYGLPDDAVASLGGALGPGALYFNEHPDTTQNDVHLHRLFLTLKSDLLRVPGLSFTLGRFEILDGLEYRTGDPSEQNDLFYSGGGAQNRRVSFGYVGRSSNSAQSLANVVETSLSHTFNKYFSGNVYLRPCIWAQRDRAVLQWAV